MKTKLLYRNKVSLANQYVRPKSVDIYLAEEILRERFAPEPWFRNYYRCPDCKSEWEDEWSATCDDECSECGTDCSPIRSKELTPEQGE